MFLKVLCALGFHRRAYRINPQYCLSWCCVRCGEMQRGPVGVRR